MKQTNVAKVRNSREVVGRVSGQRIDVELSVMGASFRPKKGEIFTAAMAGSN